PTTAIADNSAYRIWVRGGNVFGYGPWSSAQDFGTGNAFITPPASAPTVTAPTGTGNTTTPTFTWTTVTGTDYFDLWVDNLTSGTSQVIRQTHVNGTSFTPTTPIANNNAFRTWVRAGNVFGYGPWSTPVDFGTGTAFITPPATAPTLTAPLGNGIALIP